MRLILHGGAGPWTEDNHEQVLAGMQIAAERGWQVLSAGGTALDAVETATMILEDDPLFDAGVGSFLNDQGEVEMDALITDGEKIDFGAVAAVRRVRHPITLARMVMTRTPHRFFVGEGADQLAVQFGIEAMSNILFVTAQEFQAFRQRTVQQSHGTVGAVALDRSGRIATATSTGGSPNKMRGRVGDVPVYGAGGYSDNRYGGASSTGVGENIMRYFLSKRVVDLCAEGNTPDRATADSVTYVASQIPRPEVGVIAIDVAGRMGAAHTTAHMPVAWINPDGKACTSMKAPYALG